MTSNDLSPDLPVWPGLSPQRRTASYLCAALFVVGGLLAGHAIHAVPGWLSFLGGAVLWGGALFTVNLIVDNDFTDGYAPSIEPGGLFWGAATGGLLGLSVTHLPQSLWALVPLSFTALFAFLLGRGTWRERQRRIADRRRAARRAHRLAEEGEVVRGVITELTSSGPSRGGDARVKLTIRYTASDGVEYTETVDKSVPLVDLPRRGTGVTVRHLPEDPRDSEVEVDRAGVPVDGGPADPPTLVGELERLAALHDGGHLSDEEFTWAKARLLAGKG
ncbi:hypothetical protein [Kitasatospora sp. LaBMicrA B282]|uniref:hypothetical protein n=1 Tax=Kitasatospora sp. LaBMicrA B282 TaxID=3420949 RepID=UPI003D1013AA